MSVIQDILVQVFLLLGIIFGLAGNIGIALFPDIYTRLQASSTCSTTAVFSILLAGMIHSGFTPMTGKLAGITIFFLISSPVSAHIIAKYAWRENIQPWRVYNSLSKIQERKQK
jgi:multicomponent Na+:H+ antiporter subunit G